jgi:hypothetical protein
VTAISVLKELPIDPNVTAQPCPILAITIAKVGEKPALTNRGADTAKNAQESAVLSKFCQEFPDYLNGACPVSKLIKKHRSPND